MSANTGERECSMSKVAILLPDRRSFYDIPIL
jgi:hypothetical protein